ncbi:MAG: ATP-binding protein [Chloroflexota bacterium]|nr:ATP-binding protein [Chloroflexota bacterium]
MDLWINEETILDLFDVSLESAVLLDINNTVIAINEVAARRRGKSVQEIIGTCVFDIFSTEVAESRGELMSQVFRTGKSARLEDVHGGITFETSMFPIKDSQGKVSRIAVFARDITLKGQAEEKKGLYYRSLAFLSQTAMEFIDAAPEENIFERIGRLLNAMVSDAIVVVSSVDRDLRLLRVRTIQGSIEETPELREIMHSAPVDINLRMTNEATTVLKQSALQKITAQLTDTELAGSNIPKNVRKEIANILNSIDIYVMGLTRYGESFGMVSILTRQGKNFENKELVEAFLKQASIALLHRRTEMELRERSQFEEMAGMISNNFISLPSEEVDSGINNALRAFGELAGVDRAYVFTFSENGREVSNTHEWCTAGIEPQIQNLQRLSIDAFPWNMSKLVDSEAIHIPNIEDIPPEFYSEKEFLKAQDIQSLLIVPLIYQSKLVGLFGLDSVKQTRSWPPGIIPVMRTVGEMIVNAITRKQADSALKESYAMLEKRIEERTEELEELNQKLQAEIAERKQAEEEIKQYAIKLKESNAELAQYAEVASHDICAPLRAVRYYTHILRKGLADLPSFDEYEIHLDTVDSAVAEGEQLARSLLELSQIGKDDRELEQVDVGVVIRDVLGCDRPYDGLNISLAEGWPTIEAEPVLVRQIFFNLISNAAKFNSSPVKNVDIGWSHHGKAEYEFFVRDNGIGIAAHKQEEIFRPFRQIHHKEEYGGNGMGLAIVKKAAENLEGSVRVKSEPGEGSTFFVILPKGQRGNSV